jgi:hypothetical protein
MANPTFEEVRANPAYASLSDDELRGAYLKRFSESLTTAQQTPTMLERVKNFATNPTVLKTAGGVAGLALAPEATIPAMIYAGAGTAAGGLASGIARNEARSTGQVATDFAEGAAGPVVGKGLQVGAAGLRAAGKFVPKNVGFYGALSGHPSLLALRAAVDKAGLPRAMDFVGENYNKVISGIQGAGRRLMGPAAEEAAPVAAERITGQSRLLPRGIEKPYQMPTGAPKPYQSSFRQAMEGPNPEMSVVNPSEVAQARPSMSEVDALLERSGMGQPRPALRAQPRTAQQEQLSSLSTNWHPNVTASPQLTRTEGLPEFSSQAMGALNRSVGPVRPPASFVHPADISGAKFGFPELPPISESELQRIQALFQRVGAR